MKGAVEVGSQVNERVEEEGARVLGEQGILVKIGGPENDTACAPMSHTAHTVPNSI